MEPTQKELRMNPQSAIELYHLFLGKPQCSPVDEVYVSDKHVHKEIEIVYVRQGQVEIMVDRQIYALQEGNVLSVCSYALHEYQPKKVEADIIKIKFLKEWLMLPFLETAQKEAINQLFDHIFLATADQGLTKILQRMIENNLNHYEDLSCFGEITNMTAYLLEHPELVRSDHPAEISSQRYMEQAISYMQEHCSEKMTLRMLADHLGLTETYCSKYIKKNTGITFVEYLNALRVNRAQRLLWVTDLGISEIAELVGFSSVQTFNRVFKQQTCLLSPSEYRKRKKDRKKIKTD